MSAAPFPPLDLANRVGSLEGAEDPYAYYDAVGRRTREDIVAALPADWSFESRSVLDFGCGAGRTLRHFLPETASAEVWGCDIDADSVAWIQRELSPPLQVFQNGPDAAARRGVRALRPDLGAVRVHAPRGDLERMAARAAPGAQARRHPARHLHGRGHEPADGR